MFKSFFMSRRWALWAYLGAAVILGGTWYQVQVDVWINSWFGELYDLIQKALGEPGSVTLEEFYEKCFSFAKVVAVYIIVAVLLGFFIKHYVFRWRVAMNDYYMSHWDKLRHIEGAAQRVQEDTKRFAVIVQGLGISFFNAVMILIAFLPILWTLSEKITTFPIFGEVSQGLVWLALVSAASGTVLLALVGIKLPGLEFNNQKVEAAYRKELVYGEDHEDRAAPPTVKELFDHVRKNYYRLYLHYMYFDIAKYSYLQAMVIVPYLALGPTIVSGAVTLGVVQQILRAFGKVENSFQYLVNSWETIVELMSIYKRLKSFEDQIDRVDPEKITT